jgi:hypothetical protein
MIGNNQDVIARSLNAIGGWTSLGDLSCLLVLRCFQWNDSWPACHQDSGFQRTGGLAQISHKGVEQKGGRGVRKLENTELYDDTLYRPEHDRL